MGSALSTQCHRRSQPKDEVPLEKAVECISKTPFYQYLDSDTIEQFAKCFLTVKCSAAGTRVDLDSQRLYIVAKGEVDLSTTYPDHTKVEASGYLCRKREGDVINLKHTREDARRKASANSNKIDDLIEEIIVTASGNTDTLLYCADMEQLNCFVDIHPSSSKIITSTKTTQIEDKLLQVPLLQKVPRSKISVLAAMCRYEAIDSKQTVFEQDDKADKLYLVLDGCAQVIAREAPASRGLHAMTLKKQVFSEQSVALQRSLECSCSRQTLLQSHEIVIADLNSGDYFGETALLYNMDRTCKVKTLDKSLFLTIHKTDFKNFLNICPIEDTMRGVIKQRLLSKLSSLGKNVHMYAISFVFAQMLMFCFSSGIPFMSGIQEMYSSLTESVSINEVPQDNVIFREGDVGDLFYIIVHGCVEVTTSSGDGESDGDDESSSSVKTENRLGTLGPGQYFGEMALVNAGNNLRTATVTSTEKSILLSIEKDKFHKIFGSNSQVLAEFELRVLKNRAQLGHVLKHSLGLTSFRDFLEKEHAGENIDFWIAATTFVNEFVGLTKEERLTRAKKIFVTFCAEYADRQINLPHDVMLEIDTIIHKNTEVPIDTFDAATTEIYKLMEKDNFRRWKSSKEFKDYFGRLGIL